MKTMTKLRLLISLAWRISPLYMVMMVTSTLLSSGQIFANVVLPKYLVDELVGAQDVRRLVLFAGLIIASNALFALLGNATKRYLDYKNTYMSEMMQQHMAQKIMHVEYAHLETPYYLDLKERATFAISNQSSLLGFITSASELLKNLVTALSLMTLLFTLSGWLVAVLVVLIAAGTGIIAHLMKKMVYFMQELIPVNRRYGYYVSTCYDDKLQKDVRLYDMSEMMTDKVNKYNLEIIREFSALYTYQGRMMGLYGILGDLQKAVAYAYVGIRVFSNALGPRISIGSFTLYVNAVINFSSAASELTNHFVNMLQFLGYLEPFVEFMQLPNETDIGGNAPMDKDIQEIRFEHVSFQYPGSDVQVLRDVSFTIRQGEKISVVGLNGAGKTTLVKLICRLYRPTEGQIYINGHDIFEYDHTQYMRRVSAVFQDYKLLAFTVDENITGQPPGSDDARVAEIVSQVGLTEKLATLPDGTQTLLGKAYNEDGTEFSGGEQQKVAIARALYKDASLIILDEPTSALDPLAEAEIYENFNALIGGKTAIYISHRMSSSVFCDRILLLNGGSVEDFDTHAALMKNTEGLYYKLFMSQAENYRIEAELLEAQPILDLHI